MYRSARGDDSTGFQGMQRDDTGMITKLNRGHHVCADLLEVGRSVICHEQRVAAHYKSYRAHSHFGLTNQVIGVLLQRERPRTTEYRCSEAAHENAQDTDNLSIR
jgi:hypothetical protein